jgi:hypothetical protein
MAHAQDSPDDRGMTQDDIAQLRQTAASRINYILWIADRLAQPAPDRLICQEAAKLLRELVSG